MRLRSGDVEPPDRGLYVVLEKNSPLQPGEVGSRHQVIHYAAIESLAIHQPIEESP